MLTIALIFLICSDVDANRASQPATNKVAILPKVVDLLNKTRFAGAFVGKGGFAAIRKWLEPLPDKSLPSLNIREQLLDILFKVPLPMRELKANFYFFSTVAF